jgi:hypothetical protein
VLHIGQTEVDEAMLAFEAGFDARCSEWHAGVLRADRPAMSAVCNKGRGGSDSVCRKVRVNMSASISHWLGWYIVYQSSQLIRMDDRSLRGDAHSIWFSSCIRREC